MPPTLIHRHHRSAFTMLMTFPAACFVLTLGSDIIYAQTANMVWETFSIWLLTIGLIAAGLAVAIGLIEAFGLARWPSLVIRVGYAIALILGLFNAFVHSRDGYTSVMPDGLALSIAVVVVMILTWAIAIIAAPRHTNLHMGSTAA